MWSTPPAMITAAGTTPRRKIAIEERRGPDHFIVSSIQYMNGSAFHSAKKAKTPKRTM